MNGGLDLNFLLSAIRDRLWYFLIPFLAVAGLGTAFIMSLPAVYTAEAKILVESQQIPTDLVRSTVTALADERLQVLEQRVMTRDNLLSLVEKFELFSNLSDLSRTEIVDLMRSRVTIEPLSLNFASADQRTNSIAIAFSTSFDYEVPNTAVKVVNDLVTFILNEDARSRTSQAKETTRFLERETQRLAAELKTVEGQIADFKQQNSDSLPERQDLNVSLLSKVQEEITDLQRRLIANDDQKRLLEFESSIKGGTDGTGSTSSVLSIEERLKQAQTEYVVKKSVYAENHPEMRALKKSVAALQTELEAASKVIEAGTNKQSDSARKSLESRVLGEKLDAVERSKALLTKQYNDAKASADKLRTVLANTAEVGTALLELDRRRTSLQKNYDEMSAKYSQARLGQQLESDQQAERFEVLEQPTLPQKPSKPKRFTLLAAVLGLAMISGAAISGGAEYLDNTIRRKKDLTRKLDRRPIVVIPHISTKQEQRNNRLKLASKFMAGLILLAMFLTAVHLFYRPLDVMFYRLIAATPWY